MHVVECSLNRTINRLHEPRIHSDLYQMIRDRLEETLNKILSNMSALKNSNTTRVCSSFAPGHHNDNNAGSYW